MYIWSKGLFNPAFKGEVNSQQTAAYLICKKLIEKPNAVLLMTALSGKRYIKVDDEQIYVIISSHAVQIINHVYSYTIPMEGRILNKTLDIFDNRMEGDREKMDADITGNIQKSLNQIKKDLTKN
jgi:hypothetical protein